MNLQEESPKRQKKHAVVTELDFRRADVFDYGLTCSSPSGSALLLRRLMGAADIA